MARYYTEANITSTGLTKYFYHFVCESCGKDSGKMTKTIKKTEQIRLTEGGINSISQGAINDAINSAALFVNSEKMGVFNRVYNKHQYYGFKDKCPHCKKRQTWNKSYLSWYEDIGVFAGTLVFGLVSTLVIAFVGFFVSLGLFWEFVSNNLTPGSYFLYSLILGMVTFPIITLINFIIYKLRTIGNKENHIPFFDWDDVNLNKRAKEEYNEPGFEDPPADV